MTRRWRARRRAEGPERSRCINFPRPLVRSPKLARVGRDLSLAEVAKGRHTRSNEAAHVCAGPTPMSKKSAYGKVYTNYEDRLQAINNGKRNAHHRLKSANAVHNQFRHYEDSDRCARSALCLLCGVARGTRRAFRAAAPPLAGCAHTRRPWPSRRRSARPRRRRALGRVTRPQRY